MGEIFDLERLAADGARDSVYEFQFVAPSLPVTGAVDLPINPLAIGFIHDLADDLRCRLHLRHKAHALARPHRQRLDVAFHASTVVADW